MVADENTVENESVVEREEVDGQPHSRRLLLNDGEDGVRVLKDGDADEKIKKLGMGGASTGEDGFRPETVDGSELNELGGNELSIVEKTVCNDVVSKEV